MPVCFNVIVIISLLLDGKDFASKSDKLIAELSHYNQQFNCDTTSLSLHSLQI